MCKKIQQTSNRNMTTCLDQHLYVLAATSAHSRTCTHTQLYISSKLTTDAVRFDTLKYVLVHYYCYIRMATLVLLLNKVFSDCRYVPYLQRYSLTKLCDSCRWRIFGDFLPLVFSASRVQHVSDVYPKLALRPHHVWKYGRYPICDGCD